MSLFATGVESVKHEYPPDFEAAYASYPRHVGKGDALKAWAKAVKIAEPGVILAAVVAFASSPAGRAGRFVPHFGSWLGARRWEDEPAEWHRNADPKVEAAHKATDTSAVYDRFLALPSEQRIEIEREAEKRRDGRTYSRRDGIVGEMRRRGL